MTIITVADLNNAKVDVDHIAAIANSTALTATDRLGRTKNTIQGAIALATQFNDRGTWGTGTAYVRKDLYTYSGTTYVVLTNHTSTTVAADLAAGKVGIFSGNMQAMNFSATGSATVRTAQEKLEDFVHVKDYGAVGDDSTLCTAAFLDAVATGKNVYIGGFENVYQIDDEIVLAPGQKLFGDGGRIRSIFSGNAVVLDNYSEVAGIIFLTGTVSSGQIGVYIYGKSRTRVSNCGFVGIQGTGYHVQQIVDHHQGNILIGCVFSGCATGVHIAERGEYQTVVGCNIDRCGTGVRITGGNANVNACVISDNSIGVLVDAGSNDAHGRVSNCLINHSLYFAVKVDSPNVPDFKFDNCDMYYGSVWLRYCSGVFFSTCVFSSNTFYFEQALRNFFINCHFMDLPTLNHRYNGTESLTHFVDNVWATTTGTNAPDINSGYLQVERNAPHASIASSGSAQVLPFNGTVYNAVAGDLGFTYIDFFDEATSTFQNFDALKTPQRDWAMQVHAMVSLGVSSGTLDYSKIQVWLQDTNGKVIGRFSAATGPFGAVPGTQWGIFTFAGEVTLCDFRVMILNETGQTITFWTNQGNTVPSSVIVTNF